MPTHNSNSNWCSPKIPTQYSNWCPPEGEFESLVGIMQVVCHGRCHLAQTQKFKTQL